MNEHSVKQAITPLRMIFWGGMLCILDFSFSSTTNGQGLKFDVLNDGLGTILIAVGVFRLGKAPVHGRYATVMKFVQVVSVLAVLDAIRDHFVTPLPSAAYFVLDLFSLVKFSAVVAFCVAMRWFCEEALLQDASRSWSFTTVLFVIIFVIPLGLLNIIAAWAIATGTSFSYDLGPAGLLLLPVFAIPLFHLFVSTSRMKRAVEAEQQ